MTVRVARGVCVRNGVWEGCQTASVPPDGAGRAVHDVGPWSRVGGNRCLTLISHAVPVVEAGRVLFSLLPFSSCTNDTVWKLRS